MKGIIFNLVEDAVCGRFGEPVWDDLLLAAGLDGGYTSIGDYPDEELAALVSAAAGALQLPTEDVLRLLGHDAALGLAAQYPHFFAPHHHALDLLTTLNDVIHPEVRKVHRSAEPPEFGFTRVAEGELLLEYRSRRGLCALADGMVRGSAAHYGETAEVVHDRCTHRGDETCVLRCVVVPAEGSVPDGD